jgi:hypothetical protein
MPVGETRSGGVSDWPWTLSLCRAYRVSVVMGGACKNRRLLTVQPHMTASLRLGTASYERISVLPNIAGLRRGTLSWPGLRPPERLSRGPSYCACPSNLHPVLRSLSKSQTRCRRMACASAGVSHSRLHSQDETQSIRIINPGKLE